jgi:hypothetical protein
MINQRADLTFKENIKHGRHGWLRLTPAYSIKIVQQILDDNPSIQTILDPFAGTGTTGIVGGMRGLQCDLWDINPFLVWLIRTKTTTYTSEEIIQVQQLAHVVINALNGYPSGDIWIPPISHIERWWSDSHLTTLALLFKNIQHVSDDKARDLLYIAFCQTIMKWSNASFNHQSMSFKNPIGQLSLFDESETHPISDYFVDIVNNICIDAINPLSTPPQITLHDARHPFHHTNGYDAIITSPPYVNRMSYIRELRPYMYWLGYLSEARQAGELDWQAIGGTWGIATSRLSDWKPDKELNIPYLHDIIQHIDRSSSTLSQYVHKYFVDMAYHFENIYPLIKTGGQIFYIIGNSKFYDTLVPAEKIYSDLMKSSGFTNITITPIRKRNSKKELFEFLLSAKKP